MSEDLFCESSLTIQCTLGNKIKATTLVDTCATGFGFIDEKFAEIVCKKLEIQPQRLTKPKPIQGFDGRAAQPVTHAIYPTLSVGNHTESLAPLLITKLGQHPMILGRPWMKKYGILLDMINDSITYFPRYCMHLGAPLFPIPPKPEGTETIPEARQQDIFPTHILKRGSDENLNNFSRTSQKISNKKRRLINISKQKQSMDKQKPETVVISSFDNSDIKGLPIPTWASTLGTKEVDIAIMMIGADAYRAACKLKGAQVFAVSMRDLEYQAEKEAKPETNPRSVVPEEYHDLLDVFSKKDSDTLPPHRKYDHKIILEEQQKPGHAPLYKMSPQELDAVKRYLDSHLAKGFIQASSAPYSSPVLFVKKSGGGI